MAPSTTGPCDALREKYEQYRDHDLPGPAIAIDVRRWVGWAYDGS